MKFSHSLQFNAVPEWSNKYISYSQLKKLIYTLQTEQLYHKSTPPESATTTTTNNNEEEDVPLLPAHNTTTTTTTNGISTYGSQSHPGKKFRPVDIFLAALDKELVKIDKFYHIQEELIYMTFDDLVEDYNEYVQFCDSNRFVEANPLESAHNDVDNISGNDSTTQRDTQGRPRSNSSPTRRVADMESVQGSIEEAGNEIREYPDMNDNYAYCNEDSYDNTSRLSDTKERRSHGGGVVNRIFSSVHDMLAAPAMAITKTKSNNNLSIMTTGNESQLYLEQRITLKRRIISLFTHTNELKCFLELNYTGFSKICKKFDKSLETRIKKDYLERISAYHVFEEDTKLNIENLILQIMKMFANISQIQLVEAEKELNLHLREHVVWERNTVWKDMMNLERKVQSIKVNKQRLASANNNMNSNGTSSHTAHDGINTQNTHGSMHSGESHKYRLEGAQGNDLAMSAGVMPHIEYFSDLMKLKPRHVVSLIVSSNLTKFLVILGISSLFFLSTPWFDDVEQRNCFVVLVFSALLWATETLPLFVTALMIPFLIVFLPILKNQETNIPYTPVEASQYILSTMWNSVIMLLLGGFTLAAALSKYNIAKTISTHILSSAGTNPKVILLANMFVALFASMWVSNVAAPVLCYSIIQPLLRTLPKNCNYAKSLILGIALASNVGGMSSPIASPQNIISIGMMDPTPSWSTWFIVAIPVSILCVLGIWVILLLSFPIDSNVKILKIHPVSDPFTLKQWYIVAVTSVTIVLWCLANNLKNFFGEMGIISILPMVLLFGTGLLTGEDFNNFLWTIVVLAMGGTTLGKAVINSGLLVTIATHIKSMVEDQPIFVIVISFGLIIIVIATFVSHTVAAMIIAPLMKEIGDNLPGDIKHSNLLVMLTAFLCSGAMALPTSGFPNLCGISLVDDFGERYLTVGNFITRGVPATLWTYFVIVTVGYALMKFVGY